MNNQMLIGSSPKTMKIGAKEVRLMPMLPMQPSITLFIIYQNDWIHAHMCAFVYINTMNFELDGAKTKQRHNWLNQNDLSITFDWTFKYQGDLLKMGIKLKITVQQSIATARMRWKHDTEREREKEILFTLWHTMSYCIVDVYKQILLPPATPHI